MGFHFTMAEAQVRITFIDSVRGGRSMYYQGFKYKLNKKKNDTEYWRCTEPRCKSSAVTGGNILRSADREHTHVAVPFLLETDAFKVKLIHRAKTETTPIPKLYEDEISNLRRNAEVVPDGLLSQIPPFRAVKTILYRQRHKTLPRLPKNVQEIDLQGEWRLTDAGDIFLHDVNERERILIFTTEKNIELLSESSVIYGDGTFNISPHLFDQLYCIHGEIQGQVFPLVYCLMPNRKEETYVSFFRYIQNTASDLGYRLEPDTFQIDFEVAAHNAVGRVFPNSNIRGCFFHYTQCVWKAVQRFQLVKDYTEDMEVKKLVRRAAALPLVPLDKVEDVWLETISDSPQGEQVVRFMDYITTQWIEGRVFQPHVWNHFDNDGRRTNNNLEGWHHKMNNIAEKSHPNIFEVIKILKREQSVTEVKVAQLHGHWRAPPRKRRYVIIDARIRSLKDQLQNNLVSEIEYTDSVSDLLHLEP